jgi:hypothetical protein
MKQSAKHSQEFFLSNKLCLKKIVPLVFVVSAFKHRTKETKRKSIICFKINHHLLNYVGRKKEIPRISFIFLGWPYLPPKFDIELLSFLRNTK